MTILSRLWRRPDVRRHAGLALLLAAFAAGSMTVGFGSFSDEGDKLAIGLYLARGSQLYGDFFTHHLPLTYYWAAAALALLGPTVFSVRLSVLFAQVLGFGLLMRLTRLYLPLGLAAIAWEITRHLYLGQMATYNNLAALALVVIFVAAYRVLALRRAAPRELVIIGLLSGALALCDPTAVLTAAVAVALVCLARDGLRRAATIGLAAGAVLAVYGGWLLLTGTLPDAYRDVIVFNTQVYSQYTNVSLVDFAWSALGFAASGLGIFRPDFWLRPESYSPLIQLSPLAQWVFGGLLQRLAFLLLAGALLLRRQFRVALFVYLFAAGLLPRAENYVRQGGLALVSYLAVALLAPLAWREMPRRWGAARPAARLGVAALLAWPIVLGGVNLSGYLGTLSYGVTFDPYKARAAEIEALSCGRPAALGYYPGDPVLYFFSDLKPVSRYVYMWPWVAQVGLAEEINRLGQGEVIVRLVPIESIWAEPPSVFLAGLIAYVHAHYVPAGDDFYLSPELAAHCPPPEP